MRKWDTSEKGKAWHNKYKKDWLEKHPFYREKLREESSRKALAIFEQAHKKRMRAYNEGNK